MKKHKKHISGHDGGGDDLLMDILGGALPGVGMIAAHEIKSAIGGMESVSSMLGDYKDYALNGAGFLLGVALPMAFEKGSDERKAAASFGGGFAGQCLYALYVEKFRTAAGGSPIVAGWDNKAYALRGNGVKRGMNGLDNAAPGLMGAKGKMGAPLPPQHLPQPRVVAAGFGL